MTDLTEQYVTGTVQNGVLVATITADKLRDAPMVYALRDEITSLVDKSNATVVVF